jgi:hypothetical protein
MREISWPAEELLASQEGRWSMELDKYDNLRENFGNDHGSVWSIVSFLNSVWLHNYLNGVTINSIT